MSEYLHVIKKSLENQIVWNTPTPYGAELCIVESVDITNFTIDCHGQETNKFYREVPLVTVIGENHCIVPIPDIDSKVYVVQMNKQDRYVALCGKLTQLYFTSPQIISTINDKFQIVDEDGHVEFDILPNGMKLVVDGQSFKDAVNEFLQAVEQLTVMTSTGASSVPINLSAITTAKNKILSTLQ